MYGINAMLFWPILIYWSHLSFSPGCCTVAVRIYSFLGNIFLAETKVNSRAIFETLFFNHFHLCYFPFDLRPSSSICPITRVFRPYLSRSLFHCSSTIYLLRYLNLLCSSNYLMLVLCNYNTFQFFKSSLTTLKKSAGIFVFPPIWAYLCLFCSLCK